MQCGLWIPIRQFIQYLLLYLGLNVGALKFWDSSAILQYCGLGGGGKAWRSRFFGHLAYVRVSWSWSKIFDHDHSQNPNFIWSIHPLDHDHRENLGLSVAMHMVILQP